MCNLSKKFKMGIIKKREKMIETVSCTWQRNNTRVIITF